MHQEPADRQQALVAKETLAANRLHWYTAGIVTAIFLLELMRVAKS